MKYSRKKAFLVVSSLAFFHLLFLGTLLAAGEYEEAYQQTQDQFNAAVDSVDQTKEKVDDLSEKLEKVEEFVQNNPGVVPNADKILAKIKEAKDGLKGQSEMLDKFSGYAGKVKDAFDVANE